jgi:Methyltransferase domain
VIELGTRTGNSTSAFLAACELRVRGFVWSFDLAPADVPWDASGPWWSFRQLDALGPRAQAAAPDRADVLLIDLDPHAYDQTLRALELWAPRVRPGGVILCHDTEWPEINARCPQPHDSEVGRALDDFCREHGLSWENRAGNNGLGVLRLPCGHG